MTHWLGTCAVVSGMKEMPAWDNGEIIGARMGRFMEGKRF